MKRRNADCGKIRRPIKKNKIAEQIGSNTLLYFKFLLLWVSVITADFLLEFRFEFLWPFWLLLRSVYDSFKYKGLAFSVLFVCIAITSDLVCLFFIPVQWLFFAASTYVWVQYVWHTDKGICLPTIILWILFVYLEAAIRWKDSRNIPHLDLCRPFAAHCIGYPVVTLGFGFKSYVGYRIRQRKQREVAKDNDFYMQLLQEALPKEESILLEPAADGTGGPPELLASKDMVPVVASLNNSGSSTASSRSDTGQNHHHHNNHHNHNHHHHNHQQQQQQQQQQQSHSKGAQSYKSSSNSSSTAVSTPHVNGHVSSGGSSSATGGAMNGGLNHHAGGSLKHRKSLEKEGTSNSSSAVGSSNGGGKMNGGSGGSYSYHQANILQQGSGSAATSTSNTASSIAGNSTKDHGSGSGGTNHQNGGGSTAREKESKDVPGAASHTRKDCGDKEAPSGTGSSASSSSSSSSLSSATNRSKSPTETAGVMPGSGKSSVGGKQNGHVINHELQGVCGGGTGVVTGESGGGAPAQTEPKSGGGRSGRKNRLKKAAEQANLSAIAKLCATLALASSVSTLTTTTATMTPGGGTSDTTTTTTLTSTSSASTVSTASSTKDNHQHNNGEQANGGGAANKGNMTVGDSSGSSSNTHLGSTSGNGAPTNGSNKMTGSGGSSGQPQQQPSVTTTVVVQKVCESCPRLEADLKKLRTELGSHRQTENELRQKYDSTTGNLKACLQAKQKDYDELQNRYQELSNQRQQERQSLQTVERRLGEERRHRQSLEAQLNNERKHRKQAEEKAARAECGESCKMKKQQMELEIDKLQHDLLATEDSKHMAEKQARNYEQEMRKMEVQMRNREAQQNTEVLMSALAAMQDKNATLEKNLSAETRVKLDLFSALGGTRREVEILTCSLRSKEKEILDLNAKIVQLVAVMPTLTNEALCMGGPGSGTGSDGVPGASMMRLADAPQLLPPSMSGGPLNGVGGGAGGVSGQSGQQQSPMSHRVMNGPPMMSQLGSLGVLTSSMTTLPSVSSVLAGQNSGSGGSCGPPSGSVGVSLSSLGSGSGNSTGGGGQIVQMQSGNASQNGNCPSNLDPNATVYTPKNNGMVGGTEA